MFPCRLVCWDCSSGGTILLATQIGKSCVKVACPATVFGTSKCPLYAMSYHGEDELQDDEDEYASDPDGSHDESIILFSYLPPLFFLFFCITFSFRIPTPHLRSSVQKPHLLQLPLTCILRTSFSCI
jgi:hypothetical protein